MHTYMMQVVCFVRKKDIVDKRESHVFCQEYGLFLDANTNWLAEISYANEFRGETTWNVTRIA